MTIGVIGVGRVGGALGKRLVQAGHQVIYGVRNLNNEKAKALKKEQF